MCSFKIAVTHYGVSQKRSGHVDKNVKFNIPQEHIGDTLETHVLYAWCTLIYLAVGRFQAHLDSKDF